MIKALIEVKDDEKYVEIVKLLVENGIKLYDITSINSTFSEYMKKIFERRDFVSDRDIQFLFTDEDLNSNMDHFQDAWESGLSPYKALTFLTLKK